MAATEIIVQDSDGRFPSDRSRDRVISNGVGHVDHYLSRMCFVRDVAEPLDTRKIDRRSVNQVRSTGTEFNSAALVTLGNRCDAIDHIDAVNTYLKQDLYEQEEFQDLVTRLKGLFA